MEGTSLLSAKKLYRQSEAVFTDSVLGIAKKTDLTFLVGFFLLAPRLRCILLLASILARITLSSLCFQKKLKLRA
jgi:hypothetical protein